ncbi:MAG TPA: MATE family efflux transporter, partial [Anaerovoracaceae bacterium]|nr:MATE family efflux transporter [Anaerovoracaceae bacterium]
SLAFPIMTLILSISIGLGVGTNVLIARRLGARDQEGANNIVTHSLIISAVIGILVTLIALLAVKPFFHAYTDDAAIYRLGLDFTNIVVFMAFGNMLHISVQKIIQATGNMVAPMLFQIAGVVLNFVLDPILIFGLLGAPALGVKGAAIATVSGYTLSMLLGFYVLIFTKQKVKIKIKDFRIDWKVFRDIIAVGLPSLVMNALGALMVVFANIFLVAYSMTAVAFFGIYFKIQQLITMTVNGLIQGCMPVMGYNYGAKNRPRLMETFKTGLIIAMIMMSLGAVILWIFPAQALKLFQASKDMLEFGIPALRIMSASYILAACGFMFASFFQATGRVRYSLLINLLRQLILLVPLMWLLSFVIGINGIWWAFPAAEIITTIVCIALFLQKEIRSSGMRFE